MKRLTSHPITLGILIGMAIGVAILVVAIWFPGLAETIGRHQSLTQGVYFTVFFFGVWLYLLWNRHRRKMFWLTFLLLSVLHVTGVLLFTLRFRPLLVKEWTWLGLIESYFVAAFVYWSTRVRQPQVSKPNAPTPD